ncbi:MAG: tetratricopeptide repeat protein [Pseudomonadota bacterium]
MTIRVWMKWALLGLAVLVLAGCSVRFAPPEQDPESDDEVSEVEPIEEPAEDPSREEAPVERQRETGGKVPDAAKGLLASANSALEAGNDGRALDLIQRAQRIAPDAAAVYYALGRVYREQGSLARAEQFVLKGISKAGNDTELREEGWSELAGIRARLGDQAGAEDARERAGQM